VAPGMSRLLPLLCFIGCAAAAPPADYSALGTEPFWSVSIENDRMTYESLNGPNFSEAAPVSATTFNGRIWASDRLVVAATHAQCSDGMSDNIYADTVMVVVDGVIARGCGGGTVAPGTLANSHWVIQEIDGRSVIEARYFLEFGPERLSGLAGCNRFLGAYELDGETLTAGPIATTRMACPEPGMSDERRLLALLSGPLAIAHSDEDDSMLLTGGDGTIRLVQVIN